MTRIVPLADVDDQLDALRGGAITIGNFDGVHLGHAELLRQIREVADQIGGPAIAVVLDPHPAAILRPEKAPARLTWIERRAELMRPLGMDALVVCETTPEFLKLTAQEFFKLVVQRTLAAKAMVEGPNFLFGHDRGGDIHTLRDLCCRASVDLRIAEPMKIDHEMISSTRIRQLLAIGDVSAATALLGHVYRIRGSVTAGVGRGRKIGFPTANLSSIDVVIPAAGVYAGLAWIDDKPHQAAIHIGPNPTFELDGAMKVEIHLIDYDGDLYGQTLLVDFVARVRDIARFESADRLIDQLGHDMKAIRTELAHFRKSRT